jgi:hypothetical protein
VIRVFRVLLSDKSILFDETDNGIMICFTQGWIQRDLNPFLDQNYCIFPTPLHEMYVEYQYFPSLYTPFPTDMYSTPLEVYMAVVRKFSQANLLNARNGAQPGPAGFSRQKEAAFKHEFYRAYTSLLDFAGGISNEWSCGTGQIDVCITELKWGFEFLRDGDHLQEHLARFRHGGNYYGGIQSGGLKDWLVIDCRHNLPKAECMYDTFVLPLLLLYTYFTDQSTDPQERRLIRCVFKDDYHTLTILDCENKVIAPEFCLSGR